MKTNSKIFILSCLAVLGLSACSLDRTPNDPYTFMEFDKNAVFSKVYATLAMPGQTGPSGDSDVEGFDGGTSAFYRMIWEMNEFPTDEGIWIWGDPGVADVRIVNWTSSNELVTALYNRLFINITVCNHFLDKTVEMTDAETVQQRAEVRFIRAIYYYHLLDMFAAVPFSEHVSSEAPMPIKRPELFKWVVKELEDSEADLPAKRLNLYRVDKTAAQLLLARIYLNAKVYLDLQDWAEAKTYLDKAADKAAQVMNSENYHLLTTETAHADGYTYSAYQKLFMGDNDVNGAQNEGILMVYQDGAFCRAHGAGRFLLSAFRDANWMPYGSTSSWSCFRTSPEFVEYFLDGKTYEIKTFKNYKGTEDSITQVFMGGAPILENEYTMPAKLGDDRAILCSSYTYQAGFEEDGVTPKITTLNWDFTGKMAADICGCWAPLKWTGIHSTAKTPADFVGQDAEWPDTDIPFLRVAEAYLTYAEAVFRGATANNGTAEAAVQALRDRAHNSTPFTLSEDFLLDEWAREFYCEGRRRTDLVRFGQFAGPTATRNWEGRGGTKQHSGMAPKKLDKKFNFFPLPDADVTANKNLAGINAENGY